MTPVSFISPLTITASMITSSTAVSKLAGEADWNATATYSVGTVVYRPVIGRRFENKIPGVNSNPPEDDSERWYDLGATSSLSMFDSEVSTQSMCAGTLTTTFRPGAFNAMHLAGLEGSALAITIKDTPGGSPVYSYSGSLEGSQPEDYYEYYFSPFRPKTDFLVTDLAPYASCEVTISISNPSGVARCGMASLGDLVSLGGPALSGVTVEPKSYARIVTDERGKTSIKKGKAARDMAITAWVPIEDTDAVVDALTNVMGVPCTWIGTDMANYRSLRTFGLGNGKFTYDKVNYATLNLTVQGMI
ncbi:hypothetical protein [Massilia sp. X63]|uniref:hypothetical protein n=1 Tax=Massilia sp. X63 TaxID=3237285 RepID=UPI0034DD686A